MWCEGGGRQLGNERCGKMLQIVPGQSARYLERKFILGRRYSNAPLALLSYHSVPTHLDPLEP